jgi:hypothetical protein
MNFVGLARSFILGTPTLTLPRAYAQGRELGEKHRLNMRSYFSPL